MKDLTSFDLTLNDELFSSFANLIYQRSGITLAPHKKGLLTSRLMKRLKALGLSSFREYYGHVKNDEEELVQMLNSVSTNTTKFFRENYHFSYLTKTILPELFARKEERSLRIWSAGCSTGEEPYTIAIVILETMRERSIASGSWDVKILATDISTKVLGIAETGVYESEQLPDDMPHETKNRYFLKGKKEYGGLIQVKGVVKEMVRFRRLNLKDDHYPFKKTFDVIFCRNVMIYFDETMRKHVLYRYHTHLCDNGYLFLGHSETMFFKDKFKPVHITVYRRI